MLSATVERYISLHIATGHRFRTQSILLRLFARYAESRGDEVVRTETVLAWAAEAPSDYSRRDRLGVVCRFAKQMRAEDAQHQVPPSDAFGPQRPRPTPYIFAPSEISALLHAAALLPPIGSLRPQTYVTLLGLIAATGLRISEALALQLQDFSGQELIVRSTKFRKSRLIPLHDTVSRALNSYLLMRAKFAGPDPSVFLSQRGTSLRYSTVISTFLSLVRQIGIHPGPGQPGPRIHDLRHTFAVRSVEQCAGNRQAVARHMLALSTYLGHTHLADTYWYLQATPALLADTASLSEALTEGGPT
jgi:integrase